jgi:cell division protein FtsB
MLGRLFYWTQTSYRRRDLGRLSELARSRLTAVLILIAGVYFTLAFGQLVLHNHELSDRVDALRRANQETEALNQQLRLELEYYDTTGYADHVELRARDDLSMSLPGDHVIVPVVNAGSFATP